MSEAQDFSNDGAPGVDGQTWQDYEAHLEENLQSLLERAKSGTYRAPPVRRVHIPKGGSRTETRPIGIPTIEDKVLQRAVVMILEAIYERDFYPCSFGFRPGRSAHHALETLWQQSRKSSVQWVLEVDIRYADDFVIGFTDEQDARRVQEVIPQRFAKYELAIHPDKTRLVRFGRPQRKQVLPAEQPGTFTFLGFTHYWGLSLKGNWVIKRQTASSRLTRAVQAVSLWCQRNRHRPLPEQHATLCQKLRGHFGYYGITGNSSQLHSFRTVVTCVWYKWLSRRKRKPRPPWAWFTRVLQRYPLPPAIAIHSVCRTAKA